MSHIYYPSLKEFLSLSNKGNVIPVYKELNVDLDTPVSAYLKMPDAPYAFLLESAEGPEKAARYSFLGSNPSLVIKTKGANSEIIYPRKKLRRFLSNTSLLDEIKKIMRHFKAVTVAGLPRFYGGLVGYMSYDMVRFFEKIPDKNPDELKLFDSVFMLTDNILIFDHLRHTLKIVSNCLLPVGRRLSRKEKIRSYNQAIRAIESMHKDFNRPLKGVTQAPKRGRLGPKISSNYTKAGFGKMVRQAKDYIKAGDIIQVVLSQRFKTRSLTGPFQVYRRLRSSNPSPYMFFLKLDEVSLIGSSPEMLVRCEDGIAQTRPIAGTRPRGKTQYQDKKYEQELLCDAKEKAEHLMLVDLGRNDLGRVCRSGSVRVSEFMKVERYSHVMHLVSEVKGVLNQGSDIYDALTACFPAGTVSGSPKIRAMEIIDELENTRRGPYAGCVGYFSFSHNMDTCITIRTIILKGDTAYVQAGAGIVADSVPSREYTETVNKAKALIESLLKK